MTAPEIIPETATWAQGKSPRCGLITDSQAVRIVDASIMHATNVIQSIIVNRIQISFILWGAHGPIRPVHSIANEYRLATKVGNDCRLLPYPGCRLVATSAVLAIATVFGCSTPAIAETAIPEIKRWRIAKLPILPKRLLTPFWGCCGVMSPHWGGCSDVDVDHSQHGWFLTAGSFWEILRFVWQYQNGKLTFCVDPTDTDRA